MLARLKAWVRWPRRRNAAAGARLRPSRDVLAAERDGLVVLLDLRREVYLGLDEVGSTIWRALESGAPLEEVKERVAQEYAAPRAAIDGDTVRFIEDLAGRRLVLYS